MRIGPSATIADLSKIGDKSTICMNASILDSIYVGDWSVVGAGAVVTKDIPEGMVAAGVPARILRKNNERDD